MTMFKAWLSIILQKILFPSCDIPIDTDRENVWNVLQKNREAIEDIKRQIIEIENRADYERNI